MCHNPTKDVGIFHIDCDQNNIARENLIVLCEGCFNEAESKLQVGKLSIEQIAKTKNHWERECRDWRRNSKEDEQVGNVITVLERDETTTHKFSELVYHKSSTESSRLVIQLSSDELVSVEILSRSDYYYCQEYGICIENYCVIQSNYIYEFYATLIEMGCYTIVVRKESNERATIKLNFFMDFPKITIATGEKEKRPKERATSLDRSRCEKASNLHRSYIELLQKVNVQQTDLSERIDSVVRNKSSLMNDGNIRRLAAESSIDSRKLKYLMRVIDAGIKRIEDFEVILESYGSLEKAAKRVAKYRRAYKLLVKMEECALIDPASSINCRKFMQSAIRNDVPANVAEFTIIKLASGGKRLDVDAVISRMNSWLNSAYRNIISGRNSPKPLSCG
jgi:hypothetical protein